MTKSLGDRFKGYERAYNIKMPRRLPIIIRIDGKAFHTLARRWQLEKPFSEWFIKHMNEMGLVLCKNVQNCVFAYLQSDEISFLIHNYRKLNTDAWFDNKIQKMVSVSAAMASAHFNNIVGISRGDQLAMFDSRVFILPEAEVCNYFVWRQRDRERNSLQMLARSLYSHKELENKNSADMHDMIHAKGKNWNDLSTHLKRGRSIVKKDGEWVVDNEIPIFTTDRNYIEKLLECDSNE